MLNLGFGGEDNGGEYHSVYDSYYDFIHFKDPGFLYAKALSETAGRAVLRMANADILPFRFTHLYKTIDGYKNELMSLMEDKRLDARVQNLMVDEKTFEIGNDPTKHFIAPGKSEPVPYLDFSPFENALNGLRMATDSLSNLYAEKISSGQFSESFNKILFTAEQHLLSEKGLRMRPWYKHTIYAPGYYTGYGVKTMPGIREAIEENNWKQAQEQIEIAAKVLGGFAEYLKDASKE